MPRTAHGTVAPNRLRDLAALEQALPPLAAGPGMMHGDLRIDNVLIDRAGRATHLRLDLAVPGRPWFDAVTLLVTRSPAAWMRTRAWPVGTLRRRA